jgi:hypothetical protein
MVNTQTCTSCLNCVKKNCCQNWGKETLDFFMACKFVMACHDENVFCDFTIRGKIKQ